MVATNKSKKTVKKLCYKVYYVLTDAHLYSTLKIAKK